YEDDNRVGSVGKPFVNAEVKLGEPNKEGIGEVLIKGGMVFKGYYKNEEATRATFTQDGWFRTGDLGKFDKDGHLYIVGRAKDVIVLPSGKNVHPEDLEVHYLKAPLVEEMAILGVKDETAQHAGSEKLVAVIVPDFAYLKANNIANSREAIRHELDNLGRELPEYQRVRDYIIRIEPLPRTATRKIRRFELQKEIESGAISTRQARDPNQWKLSAEDAQMLDSNAGKAVAAAIGKNAKDAETIHPAMNLEIDLGLDSLSRAEVFAALEQAFGIEFDGDEAAKALTVTDAVELVRKHAGEAETTTDISADLNWSKIVTETETDLPEVRYVLKNRPVFSFFAWSLYKGFNLFFKVFTRLEVRGGENLRALQRPFLVCPNHQSFLDPFAVCSTYPLETFRHTFHVGASEFFQNALMRWLSRLLNVVPIDPDTQLMRAMKAGAAGLKSGKVLNIYPEGERAFDGKLHEFKKGAAILATELDLPILPVALDGLHKVWARASWRIRPAKVKIRFGEPFYVKDIVNAEMTDEQKYEAVTKHLKDTIAAMIAEMRAS
ncbi:MAG TPA: 1-acyl-sn-glycerol-3-phosphate acyltransferase, partial [Pyrinomonadaceae bacterium]